jgi:hypothetical protein
MATIPGGTYAVGLHADQNRWANGLLNYVPNGQSTYQGQAATVSLSPSGQISWTVTLTNSTVSPPVSGTLVFSGGTLQSDGTLQGSVAVPNNGTDSWWTTTNQISQSFKYKITAKGAAPTGGFLQYNTGQNAWQYPGCTVTGMVTFANQVGFRLTPQSGSTTYFYFGGVYNSASGNIDGGSWYSNPPTIHPGGAPDESWSAQATVNMGEDASAVATG